MIFANLLLTPNSRWVPLKGTRANSCEATSKHTPFVTSQRKIIRYPAVRLECGLAVTAQDRLPSERLSIEDATQKGEKKGEDPETQ